MRTVLRIFWQNREDGQIYVIMGSAIYRPAVCSVRLGCSRRMKLEEHVVCMEEYPNVYRVLVGKPKRVGT
jgi:hypothetical protein